MGDEYSTRHSGLRVLLHSPSTCMLLARPSELTELSMKELETWTVPGYAKFTWILSSTEQMDDKKLPYLPMEQCPFCGDIGQCAYKVQDHPPRWHRYCPYCHSRYYLKVEKHGVRTR